MKKFIIALSIAVSALFSASCNIDNSALVGDWETIEMAAQGVYQDSTVVSYNILDSKTDFLWHFAQNFLVTVDITSPNGNQKTFSAPFIYKPNDQYLTFLVAKCSNFTITDNVIEFDMEITGELMYQFLPELGSYDTEKKAYNITILGKDYIVDKAVIHCKLNKKME